MGTEAYKLGRGEVHFSKYKTGTQIGEGYRYLGNSPEWGITIETENLDHYNSDRGIRQKDKTIPLEVTRSGALVLDEVTMANIGLYLFAGDADTTVTQTASTVSDYAIADVIPGRSYQLGETATDPVGDVNISTTGLVVASGSTTYVIMDDYVVDYKRGLITIVEGGDITEGTDITVDYSTLNTTYNLVVSGDEKVEGALKYIEYNPAGENFVWTFPYVSISPNGELAFKGDEWQNIPLTVEVLKKNTLNAVYVNGVPA